jgi:hypothetical protein
MRTKSPTGSKSNLKTIAARSISQKPLKVAMNARDNDGNWAEF